MTAFVEAPFRYRAARPEQRQLRATAPVSQPLTTTTARCIYKHQHNCPACGPPINPTRRSQAINYINMAAKTSVADVRHARVSSGQETQVLQAQLSSYATCIHARSLARSMTTRSCRHTSVNTSDTSDNQQCGLEQTIRVIRDIREDDRENTTSNYVLRYFVIASLTRWRLTSPIESAALILRLSATCDDSNFDFRAKSLGFLLSKALFLIQSTCG